MAFFKFRLPSQAASDASTNLSSTPAESVEAMRRRARHRLIGASVLVILAVVGFPLVFDTQPRSVSADIAVEVPERASGKLLVDVSKQKPSSVASAEALGPKEELVLPSKTEPKLEAKPEAKPEVKAEPKVEQRVEPKSAVPAPQAVAPTSSKPVTKAEPAAAKASESKSSESKDSAARFVVQVGAFADESKVRDVRSKLEKAGFKIHAQVVETKEGPRTRVRVGPFARRDEADKVARKIKQLHLQPQVLTV